MLLIKLVGKTIHDILSRIYKSIRLSKVMAGNPTCVFSSSSEIIESTFGDYVVIFDNNNIYNSKIDSYSYVQKGSRVFNCEIGKFCSIASSVSIAPGIHDLNRITTHPALMQKSTPLPKVYAKNDYIISFKKVFIGNDVWIGEKAVVLDGVKIGNGSVIAAGSVVVKDVEPYSVVGGVPAKHIKYRFDSEVVSLLEESKWWNNSEEWFELNSELMVDADKFIEYLKNVK